MGFQIISKYLYWISAYIRDSIDIYDIGITSLQQCISFLVVGTMKYCTVHCTAWIKKQKWTNIEKYLAFNHLFVSNHCILIMNYAINGDQAHKRKVSKQIVCILNIKNNIIHIINKKYNFGLDI